MYLTLHLGNLWLCLANSSLQRLSVQQLFHHLQQFLWTRWDVQQGNKGRKYAGNQQKKDLDELEKWAEVQKPFKRPSCMYPYPLDTDLFEGPRGQTQLRNDKECCHGKGGKCHHPSKSVRPVRVDVHCVINQKVFVVNQVYDCRNLCEETHLLPHLYWG